MNSHNRLDDVFDLSLRRSLKNWVDRKNLPANGRDKLLAAAAQQEMSLSQQKSAKFTFRWNFRFQENRDQLPIRPIYGYGFESMDLLRTRMAFL
jgi:hypothetical protein